MVRLLGMSVWPCPVPPVFAFPASMTRPDTVDPLEPLEPLLRLTELLRADGVKDKDCVGELAQLLFVKLMHEMNEAGVWGGHRLSAGDSWLELGQHQGDALLPAWRRVLQRLARHADPVLAAAFAGAPTRIQSPAVLQALVDGLNELDGATLGGRAGVAARAGKPGKAKAATPSNAKTQPQASDELGELGAVDEVNSPRGHAGAPAARWRLAAVFDTLLARADDTPRALIQALVRCLAPQADEAVQDPAARAAGFLVAASRFVQAQAGPRHSAAPRTGAFTGLEAQPATRRLALMNGWLHGLAGAASGHPAVRLGSAMGEAGMALPNAQVLFCHAPTGTASGALRGDLPWPTRSRPLAVLQHALLHLDVGGRAAVVVPDELLRSGGAAAEVRRDLMDRCRLHTVLRLPADMLDAPSSVLFFDQPGDAATGST